MAHTISALKRLRQSQKRAQRNRAVKSAVRTQIKKVLELIEAKKQEEVRKEFARAVKLLDKAVAKGVLHRNNAARRKSRLAARVNAALGKPNPSKPEAAS